VPVDANASEPSCLGPPPVEHATRVIQRTSHGQLTFPRLEIPQMLWTLFVILLVLWLLGWVGFHALGAYIHIVLVLALIVLCIQLFTGRRTV
jgi:hypothetical protein